MIWIYELCKTSDDTYRLISKFPSPPCGRCLTVSTLDPGRVIMFLGTTHYFYLVPLSTHEDKWLTMNPPRKPDKNKNGAGGQCS